jgi:DNA mismatch endonuclease (patch repair protein)
LKCDIKFSKKMTDTLTVAQRSALMARVRRKNTTPEIAIRKVLHRLGLRYRLHAAELAGTPDLVLPKYNAVVFVHGCFWHHHAGCKIATIPKTNREFWLNKFLRNIRRDATTFRLLEAQGWRVFTVWECEVSSPGKAAITGETLAQRIREL